MKRIISLLLVLVMCVSSLAILAACDNGVDPSAAALAKAKELVYSMYKDTVETPKSYTVVGQVKTPDGTFSITWSDNSKYNVDVIPGDDGMVTIEIKPDPEVDVYYGLTATIKDAEGNKTSVTFGRKIPFSIDLGSDKPVAETAYKFYLTQATLNKNLFFNGKMSGEYLGTTEDPALAPDVFVEAAEGGVRFYFMDGTAKTYIQIYKNSNDKIRPQLTTTPDMVYTYDESVGVYFATIGETQYYLGTYNTYNTFSASAASYITGNNASKIGVSQFPGKFIATSKLDIVEKTPAEKVAFEKGALSILTETKSNVEVTLPAVGTNYADVTVAWALAEENAAAAIANGKLIITLQDEATTVKVRATITCGEASATKDFEIAVSAKPTVVPQVVTAPVAGTAYKLYLKQNNLNKELYFAGTMNGYYFATTEEYTTAVDVVLEEVTDGYKVSFTVEGAKKYIAIESETKTVEGVEKTFINVVFKDAVADASVFAFNTEHNTLTTVLGTDTYYLGTYNNYNTISASKIDKIGTSFPCQLVTMVDKSTISADTKVATTKDELTLPSTIVADREIVLPATGATYGDVTIDWAVTQNAAATITGGKLVITLQDAATSLTVTATLTCGDKTDTKTFTIAVNAATAGGPTIADAIAAEDNTELTVSGTVVAINARGFLIQDETGLILVYRNYDWTCDVAIGKLVTVTGAKSSYGGAAQFAATATYTVEDGSAVTYPTPTVLDAAACDAYLTATSIVPSYVKVTGVLSVSGTYYNLAIDGATIKGSIPNPANATDVAALSGKTIEITGYVLYVSGSSTKYLNFIPTSIVEVSGGDQGGTNTPTVTTSTIATVIAGDNGEYQVEGTVLAVNARSFLVKDSTGIILVYVGSAPTVAAGDVVTVKGTSSVYGGAKQLGSPEVTKTGTATVEHGTATDLDATAINAYATASTVTPLYVTVTATLSKSGTYYNLTFEGADITGSIPYPANSTELDALAGKVIDITGYVVYVSGSNTKYLNILAMDVVEAAIADDDKVTIEQSNLGLSASDLATGGTFTLPAAGTTYTDVAIAWEILTDASSVATLEGNSLTITPAAEAATVVLKATLTLNDASSSKEFTVEVASSSAAASQKTATFTVGEMELANNSVLTTATAEDITLTAAKNTGSYDPKYYTAAIRLYGGNTLTVSCASGYEIVSIVVTSATGEYIVTDAKCSCNNAAVVIADNVATITPNADGTTSVVISNTATSQFRITSIVVTYTVVE